MDLDDRAAGVVLAAEELPELQVVERALALVRELEEDLRLVDALAEPPPACDRVADLGVLAAYRLRTAGIVPQARVGDLPAERRRPRFERRQVKGASRAPPRARRACARARAARRARWWDLPPSAPSPSTIPEADERGERARPGKDVPEARVERPHGLPGDLVGVPQRLEERPLPADAAVGVDDRRDARVGGAHDRHAVLHRAQRHVREELVGAAVRPYQASLEMLTRKSAP